MSNSTSFLQTDEQNGLRVYRHEFSVRAPASEVADFHQQSASMGAITPPPVIVKVHRAPERLSEGDEMEFTLWLGPLPLHWLARIENSSPSGFSDRQLKGPFATWNHRHTFLQKDHVTLVKDEVHAQLSSHPFWRLVGWLMWINMPLLFAYRGWKTRRLLEKK